MPTSLSLTQSFGGEEDTRPGVGTPFYTSPEQQIPGLQYDTKVDMYALGIIFFEMTFTFATGMERIIVRNKIFFFLFFVFVEKKKLIFFCRL